MQDKWLAFQDRIDWSSIAIVVHRNKMADLPALVAATDVEVTSMLLLCIIYRRTTHSRGLQLSMDCPKQIGHFFDNHAEPGVKEPGVGRAAQNIWATPICG